jgi:uncharacterized RDD family membrane protein YckC
VSKARILALVAIFAAAVLGFWATWPPIRLASTIAERAAIRAAQSKTQAELIESCQQGADIECRALLRSRSPLGHYGLAAPILFALIIGGWLAFIRGRAPAPFLLPYATVELRAVSVLAEGGFVIVVTSIVRITLPVSLLHYAVLGSWFLFLSYTIAAHALWGQNIGKLIAGIKIVRADGAPIAWKEAMIRSAVDGVLGFASVLIQLTTAASLNLDTTPEHARMTVIMASAPAIFSWLESTLTAWTLSEIAVALLNRHRRAIHDYLAGTVVVRAS